MKNKFNYQVVIVFSPKAPEKNIEKILTKLGALAQANEAKIEAKDHVGVKELAYPIRKFTKGDFWTVDINGSKPLKLNEINLFLNRDIDIIRYLVLKK